MNHIKKITILVVLCLPTLFLSAQERVNLKSGRFYNIEKITDQPLTLWDYNQNTGHWDNKSSDQTHYVGFNSLQTGFFAYKNDTLFIVIKERIMGDLEILMFELSVLKQLDSITKLTTVIPLNETFIKKEDPFGRVNPYVEGTTSFRPIDNVEIEQAISKEIEDDLASIKKGYELSNIFKTLVLNVNKSGGIIFNFSSTTSEKNILETSQIDFPKIDYRNLFVNRRYRKGV